MIDAEIRSEEKYMRISIAYKEKIEKEKIENKLKELMKEHKTVEFDIHLLNKGKKQIMVIESHEEINRREVGEIFENLIKHLNIKLSNRCK
jgi:uncharacterized protein (UPF0335 family)